jgi:hypothetical protein
MKEKYFIQSQDLVSLSKKLYVDLKVTEMKKGLHKELEKMTKINCNSSLKS